MLEKYLMRKIETLGGALVRSFCAYLTGTNQRNFELDKIKIKNKFLIEKEKVNILTKKSEELLNVIVNIEDKCSFTTHFRMQQSEFSIEEYDAHYKTINQLTIKSKQLSYLHFPKILDHINEICNLINLLWGQQQHYFGHAKKEKQDRTLTEKAISEYSSKIKDKCVVVMKLLRKVQL